MAGIMIETLRERFLRKRIISESGCWITTSKPVMNSGYAQFSIGKHGKDTAHRLSYKLFKGEIPKGKNVCHSCDTKLCVNPDHLWLGSQKENLADMKNKNRQRKSENFNIFDIHTIKDMAASGYLHKNIAKKFNVSRPLITMIISGKRLESLGRVAWPTT